MAIEQTFERLGGIARQSRIKNRSHDEALPREEEWRRAKRAIRRGQQIIDLFKETQAMPSLSSEQSLLMYEKMLELTIHPEVVLVMEYVQNDIRDPRLALVPVGSATTGGMIIRDLAGTIRLNAEGQDIDLTLLYDSSIATDGVDIGELGSRVAHLIEDPEEGVPRGFKTCNGNGDSSAGNTIENRNYYIHSSKDLILESLKIVSDGGDRSYDELAILERYFKLSFPREVNERMRRWIIEGLKTLRRESKEDWYKTADMLSKALRLSGSPLKKKYFSVQTSTLRTGLNKVGRDHEFLRNEFLRQEELTDLREELVVLRQNLVDNLLKSTGIVPSDSPGQ